MTSKSPKLNVGSIVTTENSPELMQNAPNHTFAGHFPVPRQDLEQRLHLSQAVTSLDLHSVMALKSSSKMQTVED